MENKTPEKNNCKKCNLATEIPKIAQDHEYFVKDMDVNKTYYWCSCGLSQNQPFCDGSHKTTNFKCVPFKPTSDSVYLCGCKYTRNPPYCDSTHSTLGSNPTHPPCKCKDIEDLVENK